VRTAAIDFLGPYLADQPESIRDLVSKAWDDAEDVSVRITAIETLRRFDREYPGVLDGYGVGPERLADMNQFLWDLFGRQTPAGELR
jgi:hypothetical protein